MRFSSSLLVFCAVFVWRFGVLSFANRILSSTATRVSNGGDRINIGLYVPHTNFGAREYTRAIHSAIANLHKSANRSRSRPKSIINTHFLVDSVHSILLELTPSPKGLHPLTFKALFSLNSN